MSTRKGRLQEQARLTVDLLAGVVDDLLDDTVVLESVHNLTCKGAVDLQTVNQGRTVMKRPQVMSHAVVPTF